MIVLYPPVTGGRKEGVMPKEIVVEHGPRLFDDTGREIPQDEQGLVQVGWSREAEFVHVSTFTRDPVSFESNEHEAKRVHLDRRGINDLIRKLKKARNQAFGRDE